MASVEKLWDATVGYQTGLHGPKRTTLPYRVTVDDVDDNPITVMSVPNVSIEGQVPLGTFHPHDDSLVVVDYIIQERMNTLNWRVDAIYTIPIVFGEMQPLNNGWALKWQSTTETYPLHHTLEENINDRKLIGVPEYKIATAAELEPAEGAAPVVYRTQDQARHKLIRTGRTLPEPFDRGAPLISFSLTRRFLQLNANAVSASIMYLRRVNVDLFYYVMADRYTVRFDNIFGRPIESAAEGTVGGYEWEVSLDFTFNPDGFTPVKKFHVWTDEETGALAFILTPREGRQEEEFAVYRLASMNQLMSRFG